MHASVAKGGAAPSHAGNADLAASLPNGKTNEGNIFDGAPSGNYNNSGNGAVVVTPAAGGQTGGAIVQLPIPAKNDTPGGSGLGQDLPVTLPTGPAAVVPEPSSVALMMAGVLGALGVTRRRKR
jgi:hypothetical protein